jgi:REP-associated tyrosine transposase
MPRPPRDTAAGLFHITTHAIRDTDLFRDELDRRRFIDELSTAGSAPGWICIAYCLMRTHYHLLVEVDDGILPRVMQPLNFKYALWFNTRHRLRGHVMERRYYAGRIKDEAHLLASYRYVARNPVVGGLCDEPQDWPWGSYAALVSHSPTFTDPTSVLASFHERRPVAIERLRDFVEAL